MKHIIDTEQIEKLPTTWIEGQYYINKDDLRALIANSPQADDVRKDAWISVEDRLPDEFESVIAFGRLRGDKQPCATECYISQGKWWPCRKTTIHNVTHWQPLPSPPLDKARE